MKGRWMDAGTQIAVTILCFGTVASSATQGLQTGQIRGHVVDVVGATIPRASIFVRKNSPLEETIRLVTHTDNKGNFALVLPEGGYDVLVTSSGFAAGVRTVAVRHGKIREIEWKLKELGCDFPGMNCDTVL